MILATLRLNADSLSYPNRSVLLHALPLGSWQDQVVRPRVGHLRCRRHGLLVSCDHLTDADRKLFGFPTLILGTLRTDRSLSFNIYKLVNHSAVGVSHIMRRSS
jgi:hypothetical protein